ncbi:MULTISPECIES: hypothetical protein [Micromonospora]|uniref:Uncharacterized protein n=1 Tax=Micromonospora tulbaghiae TaxID=479978 RepID=A0A386WHG9_9ACTN|nr:MULTISPECIES: hypothetical protein [Micromonospora]AYF27172.1 hypothetical protein CSH63_06980 [Micromonospora tulbaghiae]OHX01878.1 hypothetical protein BFV98_02205 [Micromonospora sp. WMMB235]RLQ04018.1 hypothetical protein EAD96_16695 [Micromonospora sp. BL1]
MPDTIRNRSSLDADLPRGVTDPLLWRAAYDVAVAHRPDESGRCESLLCDGQVAPCDALTAAHRAMELAGDRHADRAEPETWRTEQRRRAA